MLCEYLQLSGCSDWEFKSDLSDITDSRDEQEGDDPAASAEIHETSSQVTCLVQTLWYALIDRRLFAFMIWTLRLVKARLVALRGYFLLRT